MQSKATTVDHYLSELPPDRREAVEAIRQVFLANIDRDVEEGMQYGMIGYYIPHRVFPAGYHCDPKQPLPFAGLASQKAGISIYLMPVYGDESLQKWFTAEWAKTGKKLDMGKSCIRVKKLEDVPLEVLAALLKRTPSQKYIERYQANLAASGKKPAGAKNAPAAEAPGGAAKSGAKKTARKKA